MRRFGGLLAVTSTLATVIASAQVPAASLRVKESTSITEWRARAASAQEVLPPARCGASPCAGSLEWITLHLDMSAPDLARPTRSGNSAVPSFELSAKHGDGSPAEVQWRTTGVSTVGGRVTVAIALQLPPLADERHRIVAGYADWVEGQAATEGERAALVHARANLIKGLESIFLQNVVGEYIITATVHDPRVQNGQPAIASASLRVVERGTFVDALKNDPRKGN